MNVYLEGASIIRYKEQYYLGLNKSLENVTGCQDSNKYHFCLLKEMLVSVILALFNHLHEVFLHKQ